jgi:hypothetical protein
MLADPVALLPHLAEAVTQTLQEGAFILCVPADDTGPLEPPTRDVRVLLRTPGRQVVLGLSLPEPLARQVAQDTLGELEAVSDDDVRDALLELANVVAGRFARAAVPPGTLVTIPPPALASAAPDAPATVLMTDGGALLRCTLRVDDP